jgi:sterol 14-demethylase
MYYLILFGICITLFIFYHIYNKIQCYLEYKHANKQSGKTLKFVPKVANNYPLIGQSFAFSKNIITYIQDCRKKYGDVFQLKIFKKTMVVICDRNLTKEYFSNKENQMSLYDVLSQIYFGDAFSDDVNSLDLIIKMVRKTAVVDFDTFTKKIKTQATIMIDRIKNNIGDKKSIKIELEKEMIRFVANTSAECFIGMQLTDECFDTVMQFTELLNKIVVMTYFLPKFVIRLCFNRKLKQYRDKIIKFMDAEINTYRVDPNKKISKVFRTGVDQEYNGKKLTNRQIGEIVICLLYVSSENTAQGLSAVLTDLAVNQSYYSKIRDTTKYMLNNDRALYAEEFLDSCVFESARLNTHIFPLNRKSKLTKNIGDYYVGDADSVALCGPIMHVYDNDDITVFNQPKKYFPERFMEPYNEKKDSTSVITWGSGIHMCPGKMFALMEIKMATALITNNFNIIMPEKINPLNYFSSSAFANRQLTVTIEKFVENTDSSNNTHAIDK